MSEKSLLKKVAGMFRPRSGRFLEFPADQVIQGPNDRAMAGFDTNFPKEWLIEDFDFTEEEADQFVAMVQEQSSDTEKYDPMDDIRRAKAEQMAKARRP